MTTAEQHPLHQILKDRIAIIDGAMGTTIRTYGMTESDIRAERFKDSKKDLLNNGDLFSLTQPKMICDIHRRFATIFCTAFVHAEDLQHLSGASEPDDWALLLHGQ